MSASRWSALAGIGLLAAAVTVVALAPASLLDLALAHASQGRLRLADTDGTIWDGRGRLVLVDRSDGRPAAASPVLTGFALPGEIAWQLRPLPLALGMIDARVRIGPMPAPVRIDGNWSEWRVSAGSLDLPAVSLSGIGSPWNTIRPAAALGLRWDPLVVRAGVPDGRVTIELRDVASAMTPVRPLGSYAIEIDGSKGELALTLGTLNGALRLDGQGTWTPRRGLRFTAQAGAEGDQRGRLQSLLVLIGRREGDRTIIRIGG